MSIVAQILSEMSGLSGAQRKMLAHLLSLWPCLQGRFNFVNLGRYSSYCERTLRRHFAQSFDWGAFNAAWIGWAVPVHHTLILALDASFIPKSGRQTPGLSWFYNGSAARTEKGLELSLLAAIDLHTNTAYALHARQTLPPATSTAASTAASECKDLGHLRESQPHWPARVRHLVADGAYTRRPFVDGVCELGLEMVGKLRRDANLRYLFTGVPSGRGRPRCYDGKVRWNEFEPTRWHNDGELEAGVTLSTATLYHVSLKRRITVALLYKATASTAGRGSQVLLFSTDLHLSGREIVRMYRARFQIEFLFRDAKGGAGLTHCQSRHTTALHFHWNAAFAALNLAKTPQRMTAPTSARAPFSWASTRQKHANQHFLRFVSAHLDWDWNLIKAHPHFQKLCNYGVIAP